MLLLSCVCVCVPTWGHAFAVVCVCVCVYARAHTLSCVQLFATPWTVAHQVPLSMGFSREEYWSGLPFPSPGDFHNSEDEPISLVSPASAGGFFTTASLGKPLMSLRKS